MTKHDFSASALDEVGPVLQAQNKEHGACGFETLALGI